MKYIISIFVLYVLIVVLFVLPFLLKETPTEKIENIYITAKSNSITGTYDISKFNIKTYKETIVYKNLTKEFIYTLKF